jgi:hypothetical protein
MDPARASRTLRVAILIVAGAIAGSLGSAIAAKPAVAATLDLSDSVRLSDGRHLNRWAYAAQGLPIRQAPSLEAPQVGSVSLTTEDGLPEVYPLLRSWADPARRRWLQVRIPARAGVRIGWAEAAAFGRANLVRTRLVVDRARFRATLFRAGRPVFRSRIGIGKAETPTPAGRFWIRERIRSADPGGVYGPWAFGTSAYSELSDWPGGGVIGIHGTDKPSLIPGRPSHGCVRLPNRAITRLARLMPIGTPVWIR